MASVGTAGPVNSSLWTGFFFYFEGIGINMLIQLWTLFGTTNFLKTYAPLFADDPTILEHPLVLLLARSWAYMIVVLGIQEVLVFSRYGSHGARACFLVAALLGDVMHLLVFVLFFKDYGVLDFGAVFGMANTVGLGVLRAIWLADFARMSPSSGAKDQGVDLGVLRDDDQASHPAPS